MEDRVKKAAGLVGGIGALAGASSAAAQDGGDLDPDLAAAGNGGTATASANGGAVAIGDGKCGLNGGGSVAVGDVCDGAVAVDAGDVFTSTSLGISADGGVAIADASGGDNNFAFVS